PETIRRWRSKYQRRAFGLIPIQTRDFIMNGSGPAYAWHVIDAAISLQNEGVGLVPGGLGGAGGGVVPFVGSYAFSTGGGDIAQHPRSATFRESIEAAFVVIEHTALKGVSATQLADYALMHGMLQVQRDRGASLGADSILSLFDVASATDAPPSLTRLDLALLVSLYSTRPGLGEYRQRRAMIEPFQRVMAYGEEGIEREGD
ncbi:MAG: hypothetical protein V2J14_08940, partial [Erythrobacter sp.]|nr:hypothetical protein [Erythrobacter sp.]